MGGERMAGEIWKSGMSRGVGGMAEFGKVGGRQLEGSYRPVLRGRPSTAGGDTGPRSAAGPGRTAPCVCAQVARPRTDRALRIAGQGSGAHGL